jgi:deoxyribodipyrimidine photo-lyase
MVEPERIQPLNDEAPAADGQYVLYWMQQSQRAAHNPALEVAIRRANDHDVPVAVGFGLMDDYPEATERHYAFMLEGLAETAGRLADRGVTMVMRRGHPRDVALELSRDAVEVVCDRGYLRHLVEWRDDVAADAGRRVTQVEGDVVVPVDLATDKAEHSARTLRPRVNRHRDRFLKRLSEIEVRRSATRLDLRGDLDPRAVDENLAAISCIRDVKRSSRFAGGTEAARARLTSFIRSNLEGYDDGRNEPADDATSHLSPYLQYGQISPVEIANKIRAAKSGSEKDVAAFLEEMIVRRELSHNFCAFEPKYDQYASLPNWARVTLREHAGDERSPRYSRAQLESAQTGDRYWNAAQLEMVKTGYMHNYMRMYWGKKILEWSKSPQQAYATTLYLNNKYLLDGLNANSYGNVAWIFGQHDRAWTERSVFGKVRYMNANGLKRKFDIERYVARVAEL